MLIKIENTGKQIIHVQDSNFKDISVELKSVIRGWFKRITTGKYFDDRFEVYINLVTGEKILIGTFDTRKQAKEFASVCRKQ